MSQQIDSEQAFFRWLYARPEWVAAIRADPPLKVLASIHEAFESLRLWFERAIRPATDSANPLFMKVIQGGYSSGLKVLCSRLAIELNVRNTGELRAWCQIAQGFMRAIGARVPEGELALRQSDIDVFFEAMRLDSNIRAGRVAEADEIAQRFCTPVCDTTNGRVAAENIPAAIRRVAWTMMHHIVGRLRPPEPQDPPTWATARRDIAATILWCDEEDVRSADRDSSFPAKGIGVALNGAKETAPPPTAAQASDGNGEKTVAARRAKLVEEAVEQYLRFVKGGNTATQETIQEHLREKFGEGMSNDALKKLLDVMRDKGLYKVRPRRRKG